MTDRVISRVLAVLFTAVVLLFAVACSDGAPEYELRTLTFDQLAEYKIIRAETASDAVMKAAIGFRDSLRDDCGLELELTTDWVKRGEPIPETGKEILIGVTNRPQTLASLSGLRYDDFAIRLDGERIVITAHSEDALEEAIAYFFAEFADGENSALNLPIGDGYIHRADYPIDKLTLDGIDIGEYGIISASDDASIEFTAENFASLIRLLTGYVLDTSGSAQYNIIFGKSNTPIPDGKGVFEAADGNICINGATPELISETTKYFLNTILGYDGINTDALPKELSVKLPDSPTVFDPQRTSEMEEINLYVNPNGSDSNGGSKSAPFATIEAARDKARLIRAASLAPITINLGAGDYFIDKSIEIDASLTQITLRAEDGAKVNLIGGKKLEASRISRVTDKAILERIYDDKARENLFMIDLADLEISELKLSRNGMSDYIPTEIYYNDTALEPARYPNRTAHDGGDGGFLETFAIDTADGGVSTLDYTVFVPDAKEHLERMAKSPAKDMCVFGYFYWQWSEINSFITEIDPERGTFTASGTGTYGVKKTDEAKRFYFYNVLEEIDVPGEMYIDRKAKVAYFYADGDPTEAEIFLSTTKVPMFEITDTSDVTLEGMSFLYSREKAVKVSDSRSVVIDGCTIAHGSANAILLERSDSCTVRNCEIYDMGRGGVYIQNCGERSELRSGNTVVTNNVIHDVTRIGESYTAAVRVGESFGVNIDHNTVYNSSHLLIQFSQSADITVEYNEIYNAIRDGADMGAIYWGRDTLTTGITIRNNYFHDSGNAQTKTGINIIYCDDGATNADIYNNIFYKCGIPGSDLVRPIAGAGQYGNMHNNIFVENGVSARFTLSPAAYMQFNVIDGKNNNKLFGETGRYSELVKVGFFTDKWKNYYKGTNWERIWENYTDEYFKYVEDEIKEYGIFDDVNNYTVEKAWINNLFTGNISISSDTLRAVAGTKYPDENGRVQYVDDAPVQSFIYCEGNYTSDTDKTDKGSSIFKKYGEDFTLTDEGLAFIRTKIPEFENIDMSEIGANIK